MEKVSITLDLSKIDKSRIEKRTFTDKSGVEHTALDYKMDLVPLTQQKFIKEGDGWRMVKTHFLAQAQTKQEREAKADTVFLGDGIMFENTNTQPSDRAPQASTNTDEINPDDIPFN